MGSTSANNMKWYFQITETKKPNKWNQETSKLWNQETKKPETKKPRNQEAKTFFHVQLRESPERWNSENFETLKLWNRETQNEKPKKREIKKPRNQETKKLIPLPPTCRQPPLHPTTLLGTRAKSLGKSVGFLFDVTSKSVGCHFYFNWTSLEMNPNPPRLHLNISSMSLSLR